jgi:hypothetical protein
LNRGRGGGVIPAMTSPLRHRLAALSLTLILATGNVAAAEQGAAIPIPPAAAILARLRPGHPRLLATAEDFAQLKERVNADATLKRWHARLVARAGRILREPPSRYEIPDGLRLLDTSRRMVDRVYTLALLYRLDGDRRYADRAWLELAAAAQFKDWNPRHFLDTAEMTHGFAIGYDWLYDVWSDEQRATLRRAMVEKGLRPGVESYRSHPSYGWWTTAKHNWNQVCNGGLGLGSPASFSTTRSGRCNSRCASSPPTARGPKDRAIGITRPSTTSSSSPRSRPRWARTSGSRICPDSTAPANFRCS